MTESQDSFNTSKVLTFSRLMKLCKLDILTYFGGADMSVVFINAGKCETPLIMKVFEFPKWGCSYSILSTFERSIHLANSLKLFFYRFIYF